jgi:hypothetical protein
MPWALVGIVVARLALHVALYASGFPSLTADEFARVVIAARWAEHPFWQTQGEWLRLYPCLYGAGPWTWWDLVWAPRILTIVFGIVGIVASVPHSGGAALAMPRARRRRTPGREPRPSLAGPTPAQRGGVPAFVIAALAA